MQGVREDTIQDCFLTLKAHSAESDLKECYKTQIPYISRLISNQAWYFPKFPAAYTNNIQ